MKKYVAVILYFGVSLLFGICFISYFTFCDPKLVNTLNSAFDKIESYIIRLATPAAAVAVGTGLLMRKFSFGDEEKLRTAKKLIRGSLFSYGFILLIDLVLQFIKTILN